MGKKVFVKVLQGLPASGKSTYARTLSKDEGFHRLCLDDFRAMLGYSSGSEDWTRGKEAVAQKAQLAALVALVEAGENVVIDNTHLTKALPDRYRKALQHHDVQFEVVSFMGVDRAQCKLRDSYRRGDGYVGPAVIDRLWRNYLSGKAKGWELTDEWMNTKPLDIRLYKAREGTQKAVICDLDGTLFHMVARGPYQWDRVETDELDTEVAEVLACKAASGHAILLVSGRDGVAREGTLRALRKHRVFYDELFMRAEKDQRGDDQVKLEIFDLLIRDHYDVRLVLDDRNKVVDLWRGLGLRTWQVAPGNF